ncbi:MAG: D-tyrosyl-tRNA(Tyr) deacylase [Candidatus Hydrogenedens sp.]|jgi:D-tyrosyl-tRNA(Tyr) deacylase|nr:D-tyrosyl-tRNA(Tyr) deacylase [Candidatus Hydrogenedens sp.]
MRAVIQRVTEAKVSIEGDVSGEIRSGLLVLLGVDVEDTEKDASLMADKIASLRIFNDENGKMNLSIKEVEGEILLISQFTLHGDCRKGRRPSFIKAAQPDQAIPLYEKVCFLLKNTYGIHTETGVFGAQMAVSLVNEGPVTLLIDTKKLF